MAGLAHSSLSSSPAYLHMLAAKSPRLGTLPTCKRLWTQSGSSSMTGAIIFMSILSVYSGKTFAFAMFSTVQPWRGKNSMFTQGFVPSLIISCVPSHARGEITATGNFTFVQTLVDSERFLIDDWGGHLYELCNTFSAALRQDLRFCHVLDRATLEGQNQHVHTRFCPSNLAMDRHLLRTVKWRGMGPAGTTLFLTKSAIFVYRFVPTQQYLALPFASGIQHTPFIFGISASTSACSFVLPLHRHLYMYLCTTPNTTLTHAYRCVGLCVRVHVLCMCTSPQEHLFCIVYSVFRRPLPCNPTTAHMCISHRRFSNYQIRASRNAHIRLI